MLNLCSHQCDVVPDNAEVSLLAVKLKAERWAYDMFTYGIVAGIVGIAVAVTGSCRITMTIPTTNRPHNSNSLKCRILLYCVQQEIVLEMWMLQLGTYQCGVGSNAAELSRFVIYPEAERWACEWIKLGRLAGTNTTAAAA